MFDVKLGTYLLHQGKDFYQDEDILELRCLIKVKNSSKTSDIILMFPKYYV